MKQITKPIFVVLSLFFFLSGCGGSDSKSPPPSAGPESYQPGTYPRFDPVVSDVPFNTDLVFAAAATSDGTANVGTATDPVRAAVNVLDGFSTSAFFDILVAGSVDPASVIAGQTVFLVALDSGGKDALNPANIVNIKESANFDAVVVSLDGETNNAVRIRPLTPLKPKTKYLVFLTDDIKDAQGQALTRSWTYNALRSPGYVVLAALEPVRTAILGWEQLAIGFLVAASEGRLTAASAAEKLVLTYTFTTTDPVAPLIAMAAPRAAIASLQINAGASPAAAVANVVALDAAGMLPTPKARPLAVAGATGIDFSMFSSALAAGVGKLYTGYIALPYYSTGPDNLPFAALLATNWQPDHTLAGALGVTVPADVDGTYNVTYRYPFAAKTSDQLVPLQVTLPEATFVPGYAGAASCGDVYASSGYPTVIYVHGITSDRSSVLALGHTLASRCIATVAIDLPMHGVAANNPLAPALNVEYGQMIPFAALYGANAPRERHFNIAGTGGAPMPMNFGNPGQNDGSGAQFINLGYLPNTRDNNRQTVMDLLNLNASLASLDSAVQAIAAPGLDLDRVYVVGVSLGGILGSVFVAVNEMAIGVDRQLGLPSNLHGIRGLVASTAATQVSQILVNSATFAPVINQGLAANGVAPGTTNYERFMYAAQSTVDSGDPVNIAQTLAQLGVPVLLQQVNGDAVMPNRAASAPLTGTEAFARLLNATQLGIGANQSLGRGLVKVTQGGHASLLRPEGGAPQVTAELQTQVVTFVLTDGAVTVGAAAPQDIETPTE
jgi:pimeloyl-ACP methyl ester carboxylesterase